MKQQKIRSKKLNTKTKDSKEWINDTEFWKILSVKFLSVINKQITEFKNLKTFSDSILTSDEQKILNIYDQKIAIIEHLDDIYKTIKYLQVNGLKTFLKQNNLSANDYLRFMYESHQIRVSSTPDICAKLADIIYNPGISENRFNWYKFVTNNKVKDLKCTSILLNLVDTIDHLRLERHKIIHFGGHKNKMIEAIETNTIDRGYLKESPDLIAFFKEGRAKAIKTLNKDMRINYNVCLKYTKLFLNSLTDDIKKLKVEINPV